MTDETFERAMAVLDELYRVIVEAADIAEASKKETYEGF